MSGRLATRNLLGEIRSGQGTFGLSMRIALFEARSGERKDLGSLVGGSKRGNGVDGSSLWI